MPTAQTNLFRPQRWVDLGPVGPPGATTFNDPHKFLDEAGRLHYGKAHTSDHPFLVANEIVTANLGHLLGLRVPDVFPTRFRGQTWVMATEITGQTCHVVDLQLVCGSASARADIARILCLDLLAMNRDRHWGNLVFMAGTRIGAIDHDRALFGWPQQRDAPLLIEHGRGGACASHRLATPEFVRSFSLSEADLAPALADIEQITLRDIEAASDGLTPSILSITDLAELRRIAAERATQIRTLSQQFVARADLPFVAVQPAP